MALPFPRPIDDAALDELRKALRFFYPAAIVERADTDTGSGPAGLTVTAPDASPDALRDVVEHFLRGHRPVDTRVVSERAGSVSARPQPDDRVPVADGVYLHGPRWGAAVAAVRAAVRRSFRREYAAPLIVGSALIPRSVLVRAGYYRKFPHQVNAVARIRNDYWDSVTVAALRPDQTAALASFYEPSDLVLNPVTCYHVYSRARELVREHGSRLFAVEGPVFRHESANHDPTRLAEFTMHELVWIGPTDEADRQFQRFVASFEALFDSLRLPFRVVTAADPFFGAEPAFARDAQLLAGSKYEIRVPLPGNDGKEISVASVNAHGSVFVTAFELSQLDAVEATCCAGIGIERVVYALLAYGLPLPVEEQET
ncbi:MULTISPECIES: aminoacyl--tRNA ligase-related protein [unclassified Micromonospora]|uniref:aminoacyl--tRNA ligase-related protein n=1 Tax=unclassified Micromonospora TaxID=2617518 RepID=UPI003327C626